MTAITIVSDFEAQKNKVSHCFHCFPIYLPPQGLLNATSFNVLWRVGFPLEEDGGQRAHYSRAVILLKTTVSICKARTVYQMLQSTFQFSRSVLSNSLWPHELQHARPPCPSPTPRVYSSSCPSSRWCHPAISSSVVPFSSWPQSLPGSGSCRQHLKCLNSLESHSQSMREVKVSLLAFTILQIRAYSGKLLAQKV